MRDGRGQRLRPATGWALAAFLVPVATLAAAVAAVAALIVAAGENRGLTVVWILATWMLAPLVFALPRKRGSGIFPAAVEADAVPALARAVGAEAQAVGAARPSRILLTLEHRVELHRSRAEAVLVVGLPLVSTTPEHALRARIGEALLRDATALRRALRHLALRVEGVALTLADLGGLAAPSRWLVTPALAVVRRAVAAQDAAVRAQLATVHPPEAIGSEDERQDGRLEFAHYWQSEILPCLDAGFLPPILDGWRRLRGAGDAPAVPDARQLEAAILAQRPEGSTLVPLTWERVPEAVWVPWLRERAAVVAELVEGVSIGGLGDMALDEMAPSAQEGVAAAMATALHDLGWAVTAAPGEPIALRGDSGTIFPFALVDRLAVDDALRATWAHEAEELGIAEVDLTLGHRHERAVEHLGTTGVRLGTGRVELRLWSTQATRRRIVRRAALPTLLAMPTLPLLVSVYRFPGVPVGAKLFTAAILVGTLVALALYLRWVVRAVRLPGTLTIDADSVRITHPTLLREPWQVPRYVLRTVTFDDSDERRGAAGERLRFLWSHSPWMDPASAEAGAGGALWSDYGAAVPLLAGRFDRPNVALVFTEPVAAPRVRRPRDESPLPGEAIGGLLLAADPSTDPEGALRRAGLLGTLTAEDARLLQEAHTGASA